MARRATWRRGAPSAAARRASGDTREGFAQHLLWERRLFADRWAAVSWPAAYGGRDASLWEWLLFEEEYYRAGGPQRVTQNGIFLLAPTVFEFGTAEQQDHILPRMAAAEDLWCQGWSEPNAGSDLAGVRSKARRVDGGWVLDGQKTWTTRGAFCTHLFGLFRTDPASERHKGLSYLLVPLDTPGVTVRGFGRLDGDEGFAEVFFEDAFLADDALPGGVVLGEVDQGWSVAMATTGSERGLTLRSPGRFMATADRLLDLYRAKGSPAHLRHRVVDAWMRAEAYQLFTLETVTAPQRGRRRRARSRRSTRSGGASSTWSCTRSPSTSSARTSTSTGRGRRATSSRCRARSTPAPTRSSGTSPPNGCWGSPADEVRPHRRPGRASATRCASCSPRSRPTRRPPTTRSSPWGSLSVLVPEAEGGLGMDEVAMVAILEETGYVALEHPILSRHDGRRPRPARPRRRRPARRARAAACST